jgi:serine/threonine protein kinase
MMLDSCGETSQALLFFSDMSDEFQVGDVIGDYQITGVLGGGGMGKVFRVRNRLSDRAEAMKVVLPGREGDADLTERFLREIKVQASLDHPNIAGLHTALQVGNRILMFMELVDGFSLEQKLRNGPLTAAEAVDCMRQVLAALAFAHSRNVIHRDIKPPNIIVTPDGIAKLTDFGIARSRGDATLTATGTAVGSLYYMPPEQIQGETADARSDLYSLGVTFYEAVTGQRPFQGENDYAIMQAHFAGAPVAPSERNPAIPRALSALILKAMSRAPELRFQTAEEFRQALATSPEALFGPAGSDPRLPAAFDPRDLAKLESGLRPALGPIARHVVTTTAGECLSLEQLQQRLAEQIPDTRQREAFLRFCQAQSATNSPVRPGTAVPPSGSTPPPGGALDPGEVEKLKQRLAVCLGPIARHLVDKQALRAKTVQELYQALAAEIPSERDRRAFLATLPR